MLFFSCHWLVGISLGFLCSVLDVESPNQGQDPFVVGDKHMVGGTPHLLEPKAPF